MLDSPYQSPWRGSIVMAPSGRIVNQASNWSRGPPRTTIGTSATHDALPPDKDIMDGLDKTPLKTIEMPTVSEDDEDIRVKDCTYIGSYNWIKSDTPTILVPGSPPLWQNRPLPYTIPPDTGVQFKDQNGYRIPKAVLLPLFEAVNKVNKASPFDWPSVDIVTDRNGLRKLTRWAEQGPQCRNFRIDLQLAGKKTVLMNRWEERNREMYSGRTFGFSFEKASTDPAPGCKDSTGHHRIVTYDLSGLKMVVRFEVDAAIPPPAKYPRRSISSIDEITKMMNEATLSRSTRFPGGQLQILEGGTQVASTAVIELTTRSQMTLKTHGFDWKDAYPQLFFSQTAHHFLAIHQRGRFTDIQKRKLTSEELQAVEDDAQVELKKVRKVLDLIREVVIEHGSEGRISLVCIDGVLKVYKRTSDESCLPEQTLSVFEV